MTRLTNHGATYSSALADRSHVAEYGTRIETSEPDTLTAPAGGLLAIVARRFRGYLYIAGQGHGDGHAWLWSGGWYDCGYSHGVHPCAFGTSAFFFSISGDHYRRIDLATLEATDHAMQIGSQGIRYVEGEMVVTGDQTLFDGVVHEFIDRGDVRGGQGHVGGYLLNGRYLEVGDCQFCGFERDGDQIAVSIVKFPENQSVFHFLSRAEVDGLPTSPPEPPMRSDRFYFGSNIFAADMVSIFDDPATLKRFDRFSLYAQNVLDPTLPVNTFNQLQANHAFEKLKQAGVPLAIEGESINDLDAVEKIRNVGGELTYYSYSEPLADLGDRPTEGVTFETKLADYVAFVHKATSLGLKTGLLEAWPRTDFATQERFVRAAADQGVVPAYWHQDIDWKLANRNHQSITAHVQACQKLADEFHMPLGVFLAGYDHATDAQYAADVWGLANTLWAISPNLAHVIVQAWASRNPGSGKQDIPANFGPDGLIASYDRIKTLFAGMTPPEPPQPEAQQMNYTLVDYVIRIKSTKPSTAAGKVTAILPDDRVASIQPDGSFGTRDPGTDNDYERAYSVQGLLLYEPIPGKRYAVKPVS